MFLRNSSFIFSVLTSTDGIILTVKEAIKALEDLSKLRQKMERNEKRLNKPEETVKPRRPSKKDDNKDEQ